ncbi:hypothetical protein DPEC_G00203240 [Dallia pectoralis]|uniref:Uncharacterized protein n=1 Tax=Dallia pectoralis TaxID=75939 RepID=A0ACC2G9C8_DALPE|nr:hypothetical protein DPEC_G00203240 [Dallia pectoralis]
MESFSKEMEGKVNGHAQPGIGAVAGVFLEMTNEKMTIYQAMKKSLLKPDTALALLEAQAATEGIVDLINKKSFSVEEAVKEGIVGPEMREKLLVAERAIDGYTDPYTNEKLSVFKAIQKDVIPKDYGFRLLDAQISTKGLYDPVEKAYISVDLATAKGHYEKGLLSERTEELKVFYDPNSQKNLNYRTLIDQCIVDSDTNYRLLPIRITFKGLRRGVSSNELLKSKIIDTETYNNLQKGKTTTRNVMLMETVKEYLEGKGSIAGVAMLSSNQRMSIYQAMKKGILMPGTALILLEAQAATGFMIDPVLNEKFSVIEAIKNKLVGPEYHAKLDSAERAVTGYTDPYTNKTISLFQALSKDLIVKEHGIRLLEAQIATGGIIDPINSHRLPVDVAYSRGFFDEDMNAILEDSGDDTKGFFDPNTKDNLTYLQLMERCVIDPGTGLCLLPLLEESDGQKHGFINYQTKLDFKKVTVKVTCGKYMGMTVSLWELLMSEYFDEHLRLDIISEYKQGHLTMTIITKKIIEVIEHSVKTTQVVFKGIRETVTATQLREADIISDKDLEELNEGKKTVEEVTEDKTVHMYLQGKESIAGVLLPDSQIMTIYQAKQKGKLMPGTALILLEAQAATGFIIDPVANRKFSVNEAAKANIIGPDLIEKLKSAEKAVTGYIDPYTGRTISLFQAMQKDLILKDHGIRLLEAQIATGGIIDPVNSHRIPVHIAYKRGYFNEEMNTILDDPSDDNKGFFDPNTHENLTYLQLMARCLSDPGTGLCLLPLKDKSNRVNIQDHIKNTFQATNVRVKYGRFSHKQETLWDLINSEYLCEDKRQELFKLYKSKMITVEEIVSIVLEIIEHKEINQQAGLNFEGLRGNVSAVDLLNFKIVDEKTYRSLIEGKLTTKDVMNIDTVRSYLKGNSCVAGVILQPSNEKMSIYEAKKKGILTPGTALCLLEAQAATGFIIDPLQNHKLTVEQALKDKIIGPELYEKLLSAEKAVIGYTDPYTGKKISLFQAMKKDLILQQHGIRLLEAQIATGGIIDPLKCLHLPLEVAYREGYFDAELNQILMDPSDDTKGFFDPRTQANLTYMEMMDQCIKEPETGVRIESTKEIMSIYQAKSKGLLTPGTSLVLLEAQAATGYVIDPVKNKKLSVEEAAAQGVVGNEWKNKLLSAESAVTGYKDPYTGNTISLFQALKKDLIVKDHGIRLLEAQIATGGIIDPVYSHRVPVEVAYKRGYFDEEMNKVLEDPGDDTKGFFDPNTQENLTYLQLVERCVTDPDTGLSLLVIVKKGETYFFIDEQTKTMLKSMTTTNAGGQFQGKTVSLWDLLYSKYITEEQRREIVQQYKSGAIPSQRFMEMILSIIQQVTTTTTSSVTTCTQLETIPTTKTITTITTETTFHGIRKDVTAGELLESKIIDKKLYEDLSAGKVTVNQVSEMDSVRKFLKGSNCIAGIYVQSSKKIMSIYDAKSKGLLTPGTSLVLLEAQAATGFVIDPVKNKKLSVEEAAAQGVVGNEWKNKLLSAERAVTGYKDPYTGNTISLFQALKKDLIVKDHGIRLLEAQIATGGIIDPVYSHRVPVEVAYKRGYFDEEMNKVLEDPGDDTKGFFDPNTQENLTYLQLVERCVTDPDTGLSLLVIVKKGETYFFIDEQTKTMLKSMTTTNAGGQFQGKTVSLWDLLYSKYITEEQRREIVQQYKSGAITSQRFMEMILSIIQQVTTTTTSSVTTCTQLETIPTTKTITTITTETTFHGIRKDVTAGELLESKIIDKKLYEDLSAGKVTVNQVSEMDSVRKFLKGSNCIAGIYVQSSKKIMSIYDAKSKGLLTPGTSLVLLEAQAATGFVIDPVKNKKLSVEEAAAQGVVGNEWKNKLLSAERAVTGYKDPYTGNTISLFQALKKDLIVKDHGIRLLEAQIATGGIIDPVYSHRVPVEVAYQRGYFDEEMNKVLEDPDDDTKGFFDPNTQENLTYLQLVERCVTDPDTGLSLLVIVKKGETYFFIDEQTKTMLKSMTTTNAGGQFQGKTVSLWDLLYSKYITEEQRREIVQQYKSGAITSQRFMEMILSIIQQVTTTTTSSVTTCTQLETIPTTKTITTITTETTFHGIRKDVTAGELLESKIIDKKLYEDLSAGKVTVNQVSEMDSVRKFLKGSNCIAGIYVQSSKKIMSIYDAKSKGLLTPGTSLVLLEAQAATGFVIDPVKNKKLSVEEAAAQGVVGNEWKNKLLSAERAVTGYKDPYTGNTISLFQALKKDLIVKDHGIRLLEAQIATGGIIDPVYSHRVPVEVAYKRGYFDEEMNKVLEDPDDDTKGFFDPNTQENLTYLQLVERCVTDPDTGLSLLVIVKKGETYFFIDEQTKTMLKSMTTTNAGGQFQGKTVSLWDLLYSKYITEEQRREIVQQYKSGAITSQRFMEMILSIIQQVTTTTTSSVTTCTQLETIPTTKTITTITTETTFHGIRKDVTAGELLESKIIDKKLYEDLSAGKVTVNQVSEMDSVRKFLKGSNCIAGIYVQSSKKIMSIYDAKSKGLLTPGTSLVLLEAQAATGFVIDPVKNKKLSVEEAAAQDHGIRLLEAQIATGGIIDPVYSHRVPVEVAYKRGYFDEEMNKVLEDPDDDTKGFFDPNTQENLTYLQLVERCVTDPDTGLSLLVIVKKGETYFFIDEQTKTMLKSMTTTNAGGQFQGKTVSLWDLLYSKYITEEQRREIVQQYKSGAITSQRFMEMILSIIQQVTTTTTSSVTTCTQLETIPTTKTITTITTETTFHGIRKDVTAGELLESKIIDKKLYEDLSAGKVTVNQVSEMDSVRKFLKGSNCIAGIYVQSSKKIMSIYDAKSKGLLTPGTSLVLLEAQAATGFVIDPVKNKKLSVEEAAAQGVVGNEWKNKLLSAERAVTGYKDPYTGNTISLFQALKKDLIVKDHGIRLLEAQIATGGIIDPVYSHRVPVEVAYREDTLMRK